MTTGMAAASILRMEGQLSVRVIDATLLVFKVLLSLVSEFVVSWIVLGLIIYISSC